MQNRVSLSESYLIYYRLFSCFKYSIETKQFTYSFYYNIKIPDWQYISEVMNLQITGKKMGTPNPIQKMMQSELTKPKTIPPKVGPPPKAKAVTQKLSIKQNSNHTQAQKPQTIRQPEPLKVQQKKQVKLTEPPKIVQQPKKQQLEPAPQIQQKHGEVTVRYNHYKQKFPIVNGILSFLPIQQKYGFAEVFKGNFLPVLKRFRNNEQIQAETIGKAVDYTWMVEQNIEYKLQIEEDQVEESKCQKKYYKAFESQKKCCPFKKNPRFDELTRQIKSMDPSQYGSAKYRELIQQRDLQDVLFS